MSEFFFRLTPDWVLRAVEAGGFLPTGHCSALNSLENRVYDIRLEDESHVVAKFYRPGRWSKGAISDEHDLLFALREAEISVCVPLRFPDGETLHSVEGIWYAVWPRTGGRAPDELSDAQIAILGRLLARIHNVGAVRSAEHRRTLGADVLVREPLKILAEGDFVPPSYGARYRSAAERIADIYEERSRDVPLHRIHGDCHLGNLLYGREGYFFLDFDDFMMGPAVQDVWMLIPGRDREGERQRELLIDAYRQFRDFDSGWLALVEPLRAMRFIHYAAWIARRWEDPAFPPTFPHFGTEEYWERETRDLEDQLARVEGGAASSSTGKRGEDPSAEPAELTNEDFFWDL